ncbi:MULTISPECIES: 2-C-methyl-D-erythritol 4-phosphate cytidylyltransferase [Dictyoglomus]|uniref:2-C-methyl-D-erythritol 4-phosphate cytidylyltransferase n=1 Tax=Dictyoglomus turgidum (strain DSM 6724 / Z-1310) TaxID=515635 RepID=B8E113_DICTD|nr:MULTISPECIES: 2-C-methyl-D-erythritol 4-phosphate cytidylyltransferase [Dictyoglomus]ACK42750.1 2-C-methyl-D-erythritol 4-phosphate cytidylyltransferase [Dictyoglomus turgidum DSM 6724]HBU30809.1 2-C-methyl-D-erythritol 4-phosphate cytidylyltransferase [Dictyoglomus sp.]
MEKITGIIVAAGKSKRFGEDKLLIDIKGMPIVYYSLRKLNDIEDLERIILVVREEMVEYYKKKISNWGLEKIYKIIPGGEERQNSVYNALKSINFSCDYILIHDAARPLISTKKIKELIDFCTEKKVSAILGIPVRDTIKVVDKNSKKVIETLDRSKLWLIQTPQMFPFEIIKKAHEKAVEDNFIGTDDASLVERLNIPVYIVEGDPLNIKITTKDDLLWIEGIIQKLELV